MDEKNMEEFLPHNWAKYNQTCSDTISSESTTNSTDSELIPLNLQSGLPNAYANTAAGLNSTIAMYRIQKSRHRKSPENPMDLQGFTKFLSVFKQAVAVF